MSAVLDPVDVSTSKKPDPLVHWSAPPHTHGLCGRKLIGDASEGAQVNCVVCVDLAGGAT